MHVIIGFAFCLGILWVLTATAWGRKVLAAMGIAMFLALAAIGGWVLSNAETAPPVQTVAQARPLDCPPLDPHQRGTDAEGDRLFYEFLNPGCSGVTHSPVN